MITTFKEPERPKSLWQRRGATKPELKYAAWDVNIGMLLSNVVMYFIILATATTLHKAGKTDIQSATDAAEALRPLAGDWARILLGLGLIGSGLLAVPCLRALRLMPLLKPQGGSSAWTRRHARQRSSTESLWFCTLIGLVVNFVGLNPIKALFWTAIINGVLAPPLLIVIMLVSNNEKIMGDKKNGALINILGWLTTAVMFAAAIGLLLTWNS